MMGPMNCRPENAMRFEEHEYRSHRIFVGAIEGPLGDGYAATVVVHHVLGSPSREHEVYRDESISGGHRWATVGEALFAGAKRGRSAIDRLSNEQRCSPGPGSLTSRSGLTTCAR
jgi:hypothetical protein